MSTLSVIILTVIITIAALAIGKLVYDARKKGDNTLPWDKIRPILTEVITQAIKLREADKQGYQFVEDYAVNYVETEITKSTFLTADEKALLSADLIRSIIRPKLQELYAKDAPAPVTTPTDPTTKG